MSPRYRPDGKLPPSEPLSPSNAHAAGIDVHAASHFVAVPPESVPADQVNPDAQLPHPVRKFGACTADLEQLAEWLKACGITSVAMESTGVYWIPLFELLTARGFEVFLVDPRQTRHAPGRPKTDVLDCQWLQRLHRYGLLTASFRPADDVVLLRSYVRQRAMLISYAGQHVQHIQKALEEMNIKLTEVVSDVLGVTGLAILQAILGGERDARQLAKLRQAQCRRTEAEIARALQGNWRDDHLFALGQALKLYEFYHVQLRDCDSRIEAQLRTFADRSAGKQLEPRTRRRRRKANEATYDVRGLLHRMAGVDLTVIEGIDAATALVVLSEIGSDLSRFPTVQRFISWLGLCPQHQGSAGQIRRRRTRRGVGRASRALRMAAQGCHRAHHALGAFYRRIQARAGGGKAVVATARKIAERVYRLLRHGEAYVRQEQAVYEASYRERTLKSLERKASLLGFRLEPTAAQP
jgi:transposase